MRRHLVVVGGGLAGLAAAIRAGDLGWRVSLYEARPRFGGATWSFDRKGLRFDNGQHVYLACCDAYRRFLGRLGVADKAPLRRLSIPVLRPRPPAEAECSFISRDDLPAPAHLVRALSTYRYLSVPDRARIGRAALAIRRLDLCDPRLDDETFASFLRRNGQSENAIASLWDLIVLPTVNLHAHEASLAICAKVFQTGLLSDRRAADIGWSQVPLTELHVTPALAVLARQGAVVRAVSKVEAIEVGDGSDRVSGVVVDGERIEADAVLLATNPEAAVALCPPQANVDVEGIRKLGSSPIIDIHVVYDRRVSEHPVAAGLGTPVQYVFDRTAAAGLDPAEGQCLAVSVSGADFEHGLGREELVSRYVEALEALFPRARSAKVLDAVVTREHHATFRATPGSARLRPKTTTALSNLVLAGAYTDTGWPATMESAVLSAERAVAALSAERAAARLSVPRSEAKETVPWPRP